MLTRPRNCPSRPCCPCDSHKLTRPTALPHACPSTHPAHPHTPLTLPTCVSVSMSDRSVGSSRYRARWCIMGRACRSTATMQPMRAAPPAAPPCRTAGPGRECVAPSGACRCGAKGKRHGDELRQVYCSSGSTSGVQLHVGRECVAPSGACRCRREQHEDELRHVYCSTRPT